MAVAGEAARKRVADPRATESLMAAECLACVYSVWVVVSELETRSGAVGA